MACRDGEHEAEWVVTRLSGAQLRASRQVVATTRSSIAATTRRALFEQQLRAQQDSLRALGRAVLLRSRRDQGPHLLPAPAGQPGRRPGLHPRRDHAQARHRRHHAGSARPRRRPPPPEPVRRRSSRPASRATSAAKQLRRRCANSATSSTASSIAPRKEPAGQVLDDLLAGHRLRNLAVRDAGARGGGDQVGAMCATSSTGWPARARRKARPCSNWRRRWRCCRCSTSRKASRTPCSWRRCMPPRAWSFATSSWSASRRACCRTASRSTPARWKKSGG